MMKKILLFIMFLLLPVSMLAISIPPLEELSIDGIDSKLDVNTKFHSGYWCNTNMINISAIPVDSNYKIIGNGNISLKEGLNKIEIKVIDSKDQSDYVYIISLDVNGSKCGAKKTNVVENPSTGSFLSVLLLLTMFLVSVVGYLKISLQSRFQ